MKRSLSLQALPFSAILKKLRTEEVGTTCLFVHLCVFVCVCARAYVVTLSPVPFPYMSAWMRVCPHVCMSVHVHFLCM